MTLGNLEPTNPSEPLHSLVCNLDDLWYLVRHPGPQLLGSDHPNKLREHHLEGVWPFAAQESRSPAQGNPPRAGEKVVWAGEPKETMKLGVDQPFAICSLTLVFLKYSLSGDHWHINTVLGANSTMERNSRPQTLCKLESRRKDKSKG